MYARQGAVGSTPFAGTKLPDYILMGIRIERDARISTLLRTPVDISVLANIQIARTGAAFPIVGPTMHQILLKQPVVHSMGDRMRKVRDASIYIELLRAQRFQCAGVIM